MPKDQDHLALLLRVHAVLHSPRSLEEIMGDLIQEVISTLRAQRGFVVLRREGKWEVLAQHHLDPKEDLPGRAFSRTIVQRVAESGQPVLAADAQQEQRFQVSSITHQNIRSVVCAPLRWGGEVQGVVYADHKVSKGVFGPTQLQILSAIADQASRALEMASLHQRLQQIHQRSASLALTGSPEGLEARAGQATLDFLMESLGQGEAPPANGPGITPSAQLTIRLFGAFRVSARGKAIEHWSTRKNRDLLAYLACQGGQPVHEEKLMDRFWSQGGRSGLHSLHNSITQLRRSLGDRGRQWVARKLDGYALGPEVWVDADQFCRDFRAGRRAAHQEQWEESLALLTRAEALAEGDFLEGIEAEWSFGPRQRMAEELSQCRSLLADHFSRRGKHVVAAELWKRVLRCDNCNEEAYRGLLLALRALGRQAEAMRVYQSCQKAYAEELDLEPPPDLRRLVDF